MFDVGASELLLIVIVAIVVIGPKDLPLALRTAGQWIGKVRRVSAHFRSGIETMIREAELEDMEKKWAEQNAAIMANTPLADGNLPAEVAAMNQTALDQAAMNQTGLDQAAFDTGGAEAGPPVMLPLSAPADTGDAPPASAPN